MGIQAAPAIQAVLEGAASGVMDRPPAQGSDQIRQTLDLALIPSHLDHLRTGEGGANRNCLKNCDTPIEYIQDH